MTGDNNPQDPDAERSKKVRSKRVKQATDGEILLRFDPNRLVEVLPRQLNPNDIAFVAVTLFSRQRILLAPENANVVKVDRRPDGFNEPIRARAITDIVSNSTVFYINSPDSVMECKVDPVTGEWVCWNNVQAG
jgi:hypothetical protein